MDVKRLIIAVCVSLATVFLGGCATTPQPTPEIAQVPTATSTPEPTPTRPFVPQIVALDPQRQVSLRFVNAATGYEALDVYAEQLALATQLRVGTSSSGARITAGDFVISVYATGASTADEPLLRAPLTFQDRNDYTLLLTNVDNILRLAAIPDDRSALPAGQSRLLVLHAAATTGSVDIGLPGQAPLLEGLQFSQSSPSIALPTGRITLQAQTNTGEVIDTTVSLRDGFGYTLILLGESPQWVEYEERVPGQASVYFVNALDPNLGNVDFYLNDMHLASDLAFGAVSEVQTIAADNSTLRVVPANSPDFGRPVIDIPLTVNNGDIIAFIAVGDENTARVIPLTASRVAPQAGTAAVAFVNADPESPSILNNGEGIIEQPLDLAYGIPLSIETLPGEERFYWRESPAPAGDVREIFDVRNFEAGSTYLYIFTGREDAPVVVLQNTLPEASLEPTAVVETSPVRWINAIPGSSVTFTLDDRPAVPDLGYAEASVMQVPEGSYTLTAATGTGSSQQVLIDVFGLEPQHIYAFGTPENPQIAIVGNQRVGTLNEEIARVRMTYIAPSATTRTLSLSFAPSLSGEINRQFSAATSGSAATMLPFGAQQLLERTAAGRMSLAGQLAAGNYDLFILDDQLEGVIATIAAAPLEGNRAYEIVIVQSLFTQAVDIFVLNLEPSS